MPGSIPNIIMILLIVGIGVLAMARTVARAVKNKYAPIETVNATVVDKQKIETFSKYAGNGKRERYVIVFSVDGKKKSFYVSQFSYGGYRVNEKGVLTYKGSKIIGFQ